MSDRRHPIFLMLILAGLVPAWCAPLAAEGSPPSAAAADSGRIAVSGGSLFYEMTGRGDTLVLVHDGLVHREIWQKQWGELARSYTLVRYDRRGYGRSPAPTGPYSNIEDLSAVFEQLDIRRAALIGMSSGGGLVVDFTLAHPDRVTAIVLVGSVVGGMGATEHMRTRGGRFRYDAHTDPERALDYYLGEDPYEMAPGSTEARARVRELMDGNRHNLDPGKHRLGRPPERPAREALGEIRVPALVLVGEHDIPDVHAWAGALEAGIPGARREVIGGAGHLIPFEQPEAFNEEVLRFLEGRDITAAIDSGRIDEAERLTADLAERYPGLKPFDENDLNQAGYAALQQGRTGEAVRLFRLNTRVYPDSWNTWDSLGEAYGVAGDLDAAIAAYARSLELNPGSPSGQEALKRLRHLRDANR